MNRFEPPPLESGTNAPALLGGVDRPRQDADHERGEERRRRPRRRERGRPTRELRPPRGGREGQRADEREQREIGAGEHGGGEEQAGQHRPPAAAAGIADRPDRRGQRGRRQERAERLGEQVARGVDQGRVERDRRRGGQPRDPPRQERPQRERGEDHQRADRGLPAVGTRDVRPVPQGGAVVDDVGGGEQERGARHPVHGVLHDVVPVDVLVDDELREDGVGPLVLGLVVRRRRRGVEPQRSPGDDDHEERYPHEAHRPRIGSGPDAGAAPGRAIRGGHALWSPACFADAQRPCSPS